MLKDRIVQAGLFLFAIALQIQITLFASETYIGLRVNAADLFLPLAGLIVFASLLLKRTAWPQWQKPFGYWAPLLLSFVFGLALLNGYRIQGEWSQWAVFNKGIGWCILVSYLLLGAWFTRNYVHFIRRWFLIPFFAALLFLFLFELIARILFYTNTHLTFVFLGFDLGYDLNGLMANRNAYAFLFLSALCIASVYLRRAETLSKIELFLFKALWLAVPLFVVMNLSRAGMIILALLILFMLITHTKFFIRQIIPLIVISLLFVPFLNQKRASFVFHTASSLQNIVHETLASEEEALQKDEHLYLGDSVRLQTFKNGLDLIKQHPLTGAGLGAGIELQKEKGQTKLVATDNTALWILTEMGPFGLLSFLAVYIVMLKSLYQKERVLKRDEQILAAGLFFVLLAFGVFSLLHEILYSRFLWFFLGLGLAVPFVKAHQPQ